MASSAGEIILTSSPDGPIVAYDAASGATLSSFSGCHSPRKGLALVGDAFIAASHVTAASSGSVRLYNWWSSAPLHCIPLPEPVSPLAATGDGTYLFCGGLSGRVHVLSIPSGDLNCSFQPHRRPVSCLCLNDDGSLLISAGDDGVISVFPILRLLDASYHDSNSQLALHEFVAHNRPITGIALVSGGCDSTIVSSSLDSMCKLWRLSDGTHLRTIQLQCAIWCVTVDQTNSKAFAGGSDGRLYVIPLKVGGTLIRSTNEAKAMEGNEAHAQQSGGAVVAIAMLRYGSHDDDHVVSASEDGIITLWEVVQSGSLLSMVRVVAHMNNCMISDLLVARGGLREKYFSVGSIRGLIPRFCVKEMACRDVREVREMEEWLSVAANDRRTAIGGLESAIGAYKSILKLLLREAQAKGGDQSHKDEGN